MVTLVMHTKENANLKYDINSATNPENNTQLTHEKFYQELTDRNKHFISKKTQARLKSLKVLIAGCGTAGGACPEALARMGIEKFILTDNGSYELTNLNRQRAFVENIGENKSVFLMNVIKKINPFIHVEALPEGVTENNVNDIVSWADLIVDAVDITSQESIKMKIALHEHAKQHQRPVFSPIDPGFSSCGIGFDYRRKESLVLDGRLDAAKKTHNPFKALFHILPLNLIPTHSLHLIVDLLEGNIESGSQITVSSDLLSAIIASCVIKYADNGEVVRHWKVNLDHFAIPRAKRILTKIKRPFYLFKIHKLLSSLE